MKRYQLICEVEEYPSVEALPAGDRELIAAASKAMESAYAPYSQFRVGAALRLVNDKIITGNNQENGAYPSGLCAERVAFFQAASRFPGNGISCMAIVASDPGPEPAAPCGACRQVMLEYEQKQGTGIRILLATQQGMVRVIRSVSELLPLYFSGNWLKK